MTAAELRVVREHLGLTGEALGLLIGVQDRTIRRWEAGQDPIPERARLDIEAVESATAETIGALVQELTDDDEVVLLTYRSNADFWAAEPLKLPFPASWHRAVAARVAEEVPGLSIDYWVPGNSDAPV